MALYTARTICLCTTKKWIPYFASLFHHNTQVREEGTDAIDEFTSNLLHRKSAKWEERKTIVQSKLGPVALIESDILKASYDPIPYLEIGVVNELFQQAIDSCDYSAIKNLTNLCVKHKTVPSLVVLLHALSICSQFGDKDTIVCMTQLCERIHPELLEKNSNFDHYIAEAIWVKGNIKNSLKIFERVYKENAYIRRRIRCSLKHLILNNVANHSEAILRSLLEFSEMLVREHNDYFPLACLWQACILSEWFSDQQLALNILEKHHNGLSLIVTNKISFVVRTSLRNHNTETVYRLNEILLKLQMTSEVCQVILSLVNYWIQQGDFRQCKEIILWSLQNDIKLPMVYQSKSLVKLLANDINDIEKQCDIKSKLTTKYKF